MVEIRGIYQVSYLGRTAQIRRGKAGREGADAVELAAAWQGRAQVIETSPGEVASVARAIAEVLAKVGPVDALVNRAGFATAGLAEMRTITATIKPAVAMDSSLALRSTISFQERRLTRA